MVLEGMIQTLVFQMRRRQPCMPSWRVVRSPVGVHHHAYHGWLINMRFCGTGWDYSSRWMRNPNLGNATFTLPQLRTLNVRNTTPVDLNSILCMCVCASDAIS